MRRCGAGPCRHPAVPAAPVGREAAWAGRACSSASPAAFCSTATRGRYALVLWPWLHRLGCASLLWIRRGPGDPSLPTHTPGPSNGEGPRTLQECQRRAPTLHPKVPGGRGSKSLPDSRRGCDGREERDEPLCWGHSGSSGPSGLGAVSGVLKAESPALRAAGRESRKPAERSPPRQALVSNEGQPSPPARPLGGQPEPPPWPRSHGGG